MQIIKGNLAAWVLAITLAVAGQAARAETFSINVASGSPPVVPWVRLISEVFIPEVNRRLEGRHTINWIESWSGTAAKVGGVLEAVESGLIEMGQIYAIFEQDKLGAAPFVLGMLGVLELLILFPQITRVFL